MYRVVTQSTEFITHETVISRPSSTLQRVFVIVGVVVFHRRRRPFLLRSSLGRRRRPRRRRCHL